MASEGSVHSADGIVLGACGDLAHHGGNSKVEEAAGQRGRGMSFLGGISASNPSTWEVESGRYKSRDNLGCSEF